MDKGKPLDGKTALVFGVASDTSIAWAIAKELSARGAKIVLGYQFRYHSRIKDLAPTLPNLVAFERCDMLKDDECEKFFGNLKTPVDIVVHAIAFAPATAFQGRLIDTTQDDFTTALQVSAHSLVKLMKYAKPHMKNGGSAMTLTYLGGVRVCANYKLMGVAKAALEAYVRELAADLGPDGIRVNAISAGPIKTLAAGGIPEFDLMLDYNKAVAPLRENVSQGDVANCAAFLASDDSKMMTGQTLYVDAGYSILGVPPLS
ncbi:MAG: SDR family oxidoreductase [Elusimicrobia bacterium]|nr:SDR family oxidoreductase [Elusimicrobiota bacterium]